MVMTMAPLHARESGHGLAVVGAIMSAHFFGMFALAPVAGRLVARAGPPPAMLLGLTILAGAAIGAGLTAGHHAAAAGVWLFMLGLGWSFTFVAGSSALTRGLTYRARVRVQGGVDALAWTPSPAPRRACCSRRRVSGRCRSPGGGRYGGAGARAAATHVGRAAGRRVRPPVISGPTRGISVLHRSRGSWLRCGNHVDPARRAGAARFPARPRSPATWPRRPASGRPAMRWERALPP